MKVLKFGGAALADADAIEHAARIIAASSECVVVTLSLIHI